MLGLTWYMVGYGCLLSEKPSHVHNCWTEWCYTSSSLWWNRLVKWCWWHSKALCGDSWLVRKVNLKLLGFPDFGPHPIILFGNLLITKTELQRTDATLTPYPHPTQSLTIAGSSPFIWLIYFLFISSTHFQFHSFDILLFIPCSFHSHPYLLLLCYFYPWSLFSYLSLHTWEMASGCSKSCLCLH